MTFDTYQSVFIVLVFIVPGFIFSSLVRKLIPLGNEDVQISFIRFITSACLNYAIWSWLIYWLFQSKYYLDFPVSTAGITFLIIFVSPAIMGMILGGIQRSGIIEKILAKIGANPVMPIPTAWDYRFSSIKFPLWILVTLKDGSQVAGYFGQKSYASSDNKERDIYIEQIYEIVPKGPWKLARSSNQGILIIGSEIKTIEFYDLNQGEHHA